MKFKFIDKMPSKSAHWGYTVTNESVKTFADLLGDRRDFQRAGGICSGGEYPMHLLLPRAGEVVVVDHCYNSLVMAVIKLLYLEKHGPEKTLDTCRNIRRNNSYGYVASLLEDGVKDTLPSCFAIHENNYIDVSGMERTWGEATVEDLKVTYDRLDKLTVIHGDLTHLKGQFDLFYLSNAFEHSSMLLERPPTAADIDGLLSEGATVLATSNHDCAHGVLPSFINPRWQRTRAKWAPGGTRWTYQIFKIGAPATTNAPAPPVVQFG